MASSTDQQQSTNSTAPTRELTVTAVVLGLVLAVVMGAANVYLGLRAGMTVSASIPAAVIAMGILQGILRRQSMWESNLVQTSASAGESLAAGIVFTMPALVLIGVWERFDFWTTSLIALSGGMLGILFMVPMRRVFVVGDPTLRFPEGLACAEVLKAGSAAATGSGAASGARLVFYGLLVGGTFKLLESLVGLVRAHVQWGTVATSRVFFVGIDISPALVAVGVIVGFNIAVQIFLGGAIGWLVALPILSAGADPLASATKQAEVIWSTQVRYMGVGAMLVGGAASIWRVRAGLLTAMEEVTGLLNNRGTEPPRETERDLRPAALIVLMIASTAVVAGVYYQVLAHSVPLTLLTLAAMLVLAFFFTAVASYIVGLVGNSNSPVSGMTITAFLATALLIYVFGYRGPQAMIATLAVAGVVCCVACTSGDVCNDLKTGFLIGASPRRQQIMQVLGVLVAAFVMAPVITVLHEGSIKAGTGGIGGTQFPAPQAKLFASLTQGFFGDETLPWNLIGWGIGIGCVLLVGDALLARGGQKFRLHVMPVAVGIYLPLGLSTAILLGGLLSVTIAHGTSGAARLKRGVLIAAGIIAGESLLGIAVGVAAYYDVKPYAWHERLSDPALNAIALSALAAVAAWIAISAKRSQSA